MTLYYVLHQTHSEFWHIQHSIFVVVVVVAVFYAGIWNHIQRYWGIFKHIEVLLGIFRLIQANSAPCVIFAYSQPCHILRLSIFRTGCLFKSLWYVDQIYWESQHTRNPGLFTTLLQLYSYTYFKTSLIKYYRIRSKLTVFKNFLRSPLRNWKSNNNNDNTNNNSIEQTL